MSVVGIKINGVSFADVLSLTVKRDLAQIAGTFELVVLDQARLNLALIAHLGLPTDGAPIKAGDKINILIDAEPVIIGTIEQVHLFWSGDDIACTIRGRDMTGALVDCTPAPSLPVEFRGVDLLHIANQICAPFGVPVRADVDIGAPFDRFVRHKHMTCMETLDSGARQRSVLLTSDGIGGLLLTRGGSSRAPAPLAIGDTVQSIDITYDWTKRFSDYFVMQDLAAHMTSAPGMLIGSVPDDAEPDDAPDAIAAAPSASIGSMGHATDPEISSYRPTVRLTRSQSGMSTLQEQAEWMCRVAKGNATTVTIPLYGFRAGPQKVLWRPNQLTSVWDPYSGIDRDMLIAGVEFELGAKGQQTRLRLVGPTAYDRINEADRKRRKGKAVPAKPADLITTVPGR